MIKQLYSWWNNFIEIIIVFDDKQLFEQLYSCSNNCFVICLFLKSPPWLNKYSWQVFRLLSWDWLIDWFSWGRCHRRGRRNYCRTPRAQSSKTKHYIKSAKSFQLKLIRIWVVWWGKKVRKYIIQNFPFNLKIS